MNAFTNNVYIYIIGIVQLGVGVSRGLVGGGGVGHELGLPISGWCLPYWMPGGGRLISIIISEFNSLYLIDTTLSYISQW